MECPTFDLRDLPPGALPVMVLALRIGQDATHRAALESLLPPKCRDSAVLEQWAWEMETPVVGASRADSCLYEMDRLRAWGNFRNLMARMFPQGIQVCVSDPRVLEQLLASLSNCVHVESIPPWELPKAP